MKTLITLRKPLLLGFGAAPGGIPFGDRNPWPRQQWRRIRLQKQWKDDMTEAGPRQGTNLWDLAQMFLKLGVSSFGGPAVHIAMMEREVVRRRGWLSHEEFLDLLGA